MTKLTIHVRVWNSGQERIFELRGQTAKALLALVDAASHRCTMLEVATWAYRFAPYCYELRRKYGLAIRIDREEHPGGWYSHHVLETPVEILSVEGLPSEIAA